MRISITAFCGRSGGILVCYSAVRLMTRFRALASKTLVFILAVLVIVMNGKLVYTNSFHIKSVNAYHIPQQVIDVADALRLDNYKPIAVLPAELLPFLRQYTADIFTPYGRNILEPAWTFHNDLYDAMEGTAMPMMWRRWQGAPATTTAPLSCCPAQSR